MCLIYFYSKTITFSLCINPFIYNNFNLRFNYYYLDIISVTHKMISI